MAGQNAEARADLTNRYNAVLKERQAFLDAQELYKTSLPLLQSEYDSARLEAATAEQMLQDAQQKLMQAQGK
jgi:hypothetical protein